MRHLITLAVLAMLTACSSAPKIDPGYAGYLQAHDRAAERRSVELAAIADASACNGDPTCVVAAKAVAALAVQGGGSHAQIAPPPRKVHWSEAFRNVTTGITPLGNIWQMIEAGANNVEIARINAEREASRDQAHASLTVGVANAFAMLPPSTYVGGDLISGTQHIGDTVGRDQIGGSQHIGDWRTGDDIRRDTIGGDRTDYGNGNRLGSPGPFDLNDVGNSGYRCSGMWCENPSNAEPAE